MWALARFVMALAVFSWDIREHILEGIQTSPAEGIVSIRRPARRGFCGATRSRVARLFIDQIFTRIACSGFAMKIIYLRNGKLAIAGLVVGCFLAALAPAARAALGGNYSSIESDAAAMRGVMAQSSSQGLNPSDSYDVKTFITATGVTVREYVARSGEIFGIAWEGRRPPDLSVLLGAYYSEYAATAALKPKANLHREEIASPHSVVILRGHMGHLIGRAYVQSLAPSGVDANAVVK
jgi:hypothetical protein